MDRRSPLIPELEERLQEAEQSLARERELRERAEEANRRKDQFLAILSHEMRSPLNAVLTWVHVLRSGRLDPATTEQALNSIERSARLQARMIEDLLDSARIIAGKLSLELETADISRIVQTAVDTAQSSAGEKGVELCSTIATGFGPMRADPIRLQQVISNLLSNAIKFTPAGGSVRVELRCSAELAEIEVNDTGVGISPELLPHIFDPFRQGDSSTTRRHGGLGLGLAIARHLIELHGGEIEASSAGPNRGTAFRIRLPRDTEILRGAANSPPVHGAALEPLANLDVVVVDDDPETCDALELVLRRAGSHVRCARSAQEARRAVEQARPAVLVTDLAMPEEDGFSLLSSLRRTDPSLPVIALTAAATPEERSRVRAAGFALHITKPVDSVELLHAIASAARGRAEEFARTRRRENRGAVT